MTAEIISAIQLLTVFIAWGLMILAARHQFKREKTNPTKGL